MIYNDKLLVILEISNTLHHYLKDNKHEVFVFTD